MITGQEGPTPLDVVEDVERVWKKLQEKKGTDFWAKAPLPEIRAKLTECYMVWNVSSDDSEYQELLHIIVTARILALRVRELRV